MSQAAVPARADRIALIAALASFALHAAFAGRYDLFRDELYFIVCGQHPAFGYVDQPPLVPLVAAALHGTGLGVWAVRLPATVAAAALVWLAVRFARLLGGGNAAAVLAALACALAPMLLGSTGTLNTSAFDPLAWTAIAFCLVAALRRGEGKWLIWAGIAAGVILQVKYAALFWLFGLTLGLLATPERRIFAMRPLYWGAALAALIAAPSFVWQALHGFPFLELGAAAADKNAQVSLLPFLANQLFVMNPGFAPLLLAGLAAPFASARFRDLRFIAIACAVVFAIVRLGNGKDYYLAPLYPVLFTIGAVALVPLLTTPLRKAAGATAIGLAVAISVATAPIALPILPPGRLVGYLEATGLAPQPQERNTAETGLPQHFADQLGWHDFAAQVTAAWQRIPPAERARTSIIADNYGEAAALDLYAPSLPAALSGHNQYWMWGLRGQDPANLLVITDEPETLAPHCARVRVLGRTFSRYAMAYENANVLAYCERTRRPLAEAWPRLKTFR